MKPTAPKAPPRAALVLALASSFGSTPQDSVSPFFVPRAQDRPGLDSLPWQGGDAAGCYQGLAAGLLGLVPSAIAGSDPLCQLPADAQAPGGVGDDATLRSMVTRFLGEEDAWRLCVLAHHLRLQTTLRWGTIWMIPGEPLDALWNCAAADSLPVRRAFALIALQDVHGFQSAPYLEDDSLLVRAAAARCLAPPAGITEAAAAPIVTRLLGLLASERPSVRRAAARALGPWIHREEDRAALDDLAATDPDEGVRAAALEALGTVPCLRARARLLGVLADPGAAPSLQAAARRGLAHRGILP